MWQSCFWSSFFNFILPWSIYDSRAADDSLAALKLIPDWFITSKMIKNLLTALYTDENIFYFNEDSGDIVFSCNKMGNNIV